MEYQNTSNGKAAKKSTNTRGYQLINGEHPLNPSTMQVGWWDNFLTIAINPALDPGERKPDRMFNYNVQVNTALSPEKCILLHRLIEENVIPAREKNEKSFSGVPVGGGSLIGVGTRLNDEGKAELYLGLFKNLNETDKKPETELCYFFNMKSLVVHNYDSSTGTFNSEEVEGTEFELFMRTLDVASKVLSHGTAHSERTVNRFQNDRLNDNVVAIGNKVGADVSAGYGGKTTYRTRDIFSSGSNGSSSNTDSSATLEEKEGLDELPF